MKNLSTREDTQTSKISLYHLVLFVVSLPFDRFYSELVLILFGVHTVIHLRKGRWKAIQWSRVLLLQSVFAVTVLATLYTQYHREAFAVWGLQLSIFLIPLLFAMAPVEWASVRRPVLGAFAVACTMAVAYLDIDALRIIRYNHLGWTALFSGQFINHNFSSPLGIHPTYLSMYAAFSIVCLLVWVNRSPSRIVRLGCLFSIALLTMSLLQLGSKAVLGAFLLLVVCSPFFISGYPVRKRLLLFSALFVVMAVGLVFTSDSLRQRFIDGLVDDITRTDTGHTKDEYRIVRWKAAWSRVGESPVFGYGTGSEIPLLKEAYFRRKLYNSYINALNTHNQYLSFLMTAGVAGLLLFLATLFAGFRQAMRSRDYALFGFLVLVAVVSFSENILSVNKGIFFYAFFFSLLLFTMPPQTLKALHERQPSARRKRIIYKSTLPGKTLHHEPALPSFHLNQESL